MGEAQETINQQEDTTMAAKKTESNTVIVYRSNGEPVMRNGVAVVADPKKLVPLKDELTGEIMLDENGQQKMTRPAKEPSAKEVAKELRELVGDVNAAIAAAKGKGLALDLSFTEDQLSLGRIILQEEI